MTRRRRPSWGPIEQAALILALTGIAAVLAILAMGYWPGVIGR